TASESVIRDANVAVEVSALSRAQLLVQTTLSTLQIAGSQPTQVLSLLS
ncbi:MAG: flagellin, partial [Phycisphaerae bacterium]